MSRVFFTSDLHYAHENLCKGLRKLTAKESNELIVSNWNSAVNKRDIVYVLGDLTMEKHQPIAELLKKLKGDIRVIGGNHDDIRCCREYMQLGIPVMGVLQYKGFFCTHIPIHPRELDFCRGNIHGHLHIGGVMDDYGEYSPYALGDGYYNVNTELHNYTPVLFSTIEDYFMSLNKQ